MKYRLLIFVFLGVVLTFQSCMQGIQPKKMTDKYFSEWNDVVIHTPTFAKEKGFTKYDEMIAFLEKTIEKDKDYCSIAYIGESQKGKKIPAVRINKIAQSPKVKVWLQGGLHGDEPAGTEGMLFLIEQLLHNPEYHVLLDNIDLMIVPMANIDGYEKQDRYAANGLDLNRDLTKVAAEETQHLMTAFNAFQPEVAIDFHEFRPFRKDFTHYSGFGVSNPYDAMFLYSGNPNIPDEIFNATEKLFIAEADKALDGKGLTHHHYFRTREEYGKEYFSMGGTSPQSTASAYPLTNCIGMLMEIRGVGLGRTGFARRVYTTFLLATTYLKAASNHVTEIKETLAAARNFKPEIAVTNKSHIIDTTLAMLDIDKNEMVDIEVELHDMFRSKPDLVRKRPAAYYFLPEASRAIEKLKILGFDIKTLEIAQTIEVESYQVVRYAESGIVFEGVYEQIVRTKLVKKSILFPKGSFVVMTDQKNGNLLTELIEPEAISSFVRLQILKTKKGSELPVYRKMN
jgi:hypothetical protein